VERIRGLIPEIVLTTDIIAGFCSETDVEFADTVDLMKAVEFHSAYIFKYSERKNTLAARKFPDDVPETVKADRVTKLIDFQRAMSLKKNLEMIGKTVEVLVEGESKRSTDQWTGRTEGNIVTVFPKTTAALKPGSLTPVRITDATITTLYGESV
jgi:tRNA-2-methylthio-N6-dimethylallyladenosine synthase